MKAYKVFTVIALAAILFAAPAQAKPSGQVWRAEGDVHPLGNPHYWLDPDNGRRVAKGIAARLGEMDPSNAAYFQQRFQDFDKRLTEAEKRWDAQMAPYRGRKVVSYH